jgi:hypothetical protein
MISANLRCKIVRQFFLAQKPYGLDAHRKLSSGQYNGRRQLEGGAEEQRRIEEGRHEVTCQDTRPKAWG